MMSVRSNRTYIGGDQIREIRRRTTITFSDLKQNLGCHKFKDDREVETVVKRWLMVKETGLCQQGTEHLSHDMINTQSYGEEYAAKQCDCSTVKQELFLFEVKLNNPKNIDVELIF